MIQVCSRCGTRWNVRDRRRAWCPRCNGALWAPLTDAQEAELRWSQQPPGVPAAASPTSVPMLSPGYRWIAVRPGPPPPPRSRPRPLGPTPHYPVIPRWTLTDWRAPLAAAAKPSVRRGPSPAAVRRTLVVTAAALATAALMQAVVYGLLIINRTTLLHPVLAGAGLWLSRLASVAAIIAVIGCAVVLTRWLAARRSAAFAQQRLPDPRPARAVWAGCLTPVVNLAWAPVYVIELAAREGQFPRLRKPIVRWWLVWTLSTAAAIFATVTSYAHDAQGIADNTVAMAVAYLLGLAAVATAASVFAGFENRPIDRPAHHWVVVAADRDGAEPQPVPLAPEAAREPVRREPAA